MFARYWDILLVDDEPDVLSVSRLALKGLTVYGLPLRLHEARSKAEAASLLRAGLSGAVAGIGQIAVAFIDVVMETDTAGLDLCRFIREELQNRTTQIYVRTGQPGLAPERSVIDRYDINGYTLKVDATPDKLYMLVKSGVRQHYATSMARVHADLTQELISVSHSRDQMRAVLDGFAARARTDAQGRPLDSVEMRASYVAGDEVIARNWHADPRQVLAHRDRLAAQQGVPLGNGDTYVADGNHVLVQIAKGPTTDEVSFVCTGAATPPDFWLHLLHGYVRSFAVLWRKTAYLAQIRQDIDIRAWVGTYAGPEKGAE